MVNVSSNHFNSQMLQEDRDGGASSETEERSESECESIVSDDDLADDGASSLPSDHPRITALGWMSEVSGVRTAGDSAAGAGTGV